MHTDFVIIKFNATRLCMKGIKIEYGAILRNGFSRARVDTVNMENVCICTCVYVNMWWWHMNIMMTIKSRITVDSRVSPSMNYQARREASLRSVFPRAWPAPPRSTTALVLYRQRSRRETNSPETTRTPLLIQHFKYCNNYSHWQDMRCGQPSVLPIQMVIDGRD